MTGTVVGHVEPGSQLLQVWEWRVYNYKYLGVTLTCSLSWSLHINAIIKKAKRLIGLVYRNFYHNSTSNTLLSLYKSIIRPILEYGCTVWDPSSISASYSLEAVQYFALKMIAKSWSSSYSSLLSSLKVQTLSQRRRKHKLILFFKISQDISHTLSPSLKITTPTCLLRSQFDFKVPFCRTQTF